jgi:diguanylate cyclase (GGDEF)-like protein
MEQELARFHRFGKPVALLMLDIDHFKQINDRHGHAVGDAVLQHFAILARGTLRKIDLIGRLGGEEFAALLPGTELDGARLYAERLRQEMETHPCPSTAQEIAFTVSIGLTLFDRNDSTTDLPLARADAALYCAKHNGRNRVEIG